MRERREREVDLLREQYPGVHHAADFDWVVVEDLMLPDGYNRDTTDILIFLPAGYPETPPDNFFVPAGFRLVNGRQPESFNTNHRTHNGEQWDRYSWHEDGGWSAGQRIEDGSNLVTFMGGVEDRLQEVE